MNDKSRKRGGRRHKGDNKTYKTNKQANTPRQFLPPTKQDLCKAALSFASDTLKTGGHFVCKFYQGSEDRAFEALLKKMFAKVHREKPESSRSVSVTDSSTYSSTPCSWTRLLEVLRIFPARTDMLL